LPWTAPSGAPAPTQSPPDDSPRPPQPSRPLRSPQRPAERPRPSSPASSPPRRRVLPPLLAVGKAKAGHPTPAVHPRSGGPDSISPGPILAVRRRSNGPGTLPSHPAPALPAGPACQPARARAARLAPPVSCSGCRALARPPADLILRVNLRSDGRRSPIPLRPLVFLKRPPVF
jgi:hypothetical protein